MVDGVTNTSALDPSSSALNCSERPVSAGQAAVNPYLGEKAATYRVDKWSLLLSAEIDLPGLGLYGIPPSTSPTVMVSKEWTSDDCDQVDTGEATQWRTRS